MSERKFRSSHVWYDSYGNECECAVEVVYSFHRGYPQTWDEPGCDDSVEIQSVTPLVEGYEIGDVDLNAWAEEAMEDWHDYQADALDRKAEARRDDLMLERGL